MHPGVEQHSASGELPLVSGAGTQGTRAWGGAVTSSVDHKDENGSNAEH